MYYNITTVNHNFKYEREIIMKKTILSTEKLCKTFSSGGRQQHVIVNMDLNVYEGDFTIIMGSSGAGKTTLLYSLSGMDKPTLGKINFSGEEITKYTNDKLAVFRRKHCGFVFQQIYLMDTMSIMDNAIAAGLLISKDKKAIVDMAKRLFSQVGISEEIYRKFPSQVSGGEAQRCAVVRSLINSPNIVFADEPTGALNSTYSNAVLDVLSEVNNSGQSIVMVTHDLKSARRGNRIIYLSDGKVCGECDLGKYISGDKERHAKIAEFLNKMGW